MTEEECFEAEKVHRCVVLSFLPRKCCPQFSPRQGGLVPSASTLPSTYAFLSKRNTEKLLRVFDWSELNRYMSGKAERPDGGYESNVEHVMISGIAESGGHS